MAPFNRPAVRSWANLAAMPSASPNGSVAWSIADASFALKAGGAWGLISSGGGPSGQWAAFLDVGNADVAPAAINTLYRQEVIAAARSFVLPASAPANAGKKIGLQCELTADVAGNTVTVGKTGGDTILASTAALTAAQDKINAQVYRAVFVDSGTGEWFAESIQLSNL